MNKKGFTLIELLIVVAIIAILAAIAVPNFLEAQVRAKVSRVKSDQRTLTVALESYCVDNQRGPICANENANFFNMPGYNNASALSQLTTPIAYVTSILRDPFIEKGAVNRGNLAFSTYAYVYRSYFKPERYATNHPIAKIGAAGYLYALHSFGPSRDASKPDHTGNGTFSLMLGGSEGMGIYDPTNGTTSYGWIVRTNQGEVTGSDFARFK